MNDAVDPALVAPSRHCLYIRGLPSRIKADEVRRYFVDNEANCSIDFFSYTGSQAALNIALRFESHDIAKRIMRRYNESGLLGCRVSIVWFKDMVRARQRVRADSQLRARVQRAQQGRGLSGSVSPPPARFGQQSRSPSSSRSRQRRPSRSNSRSRSQLSRSRSRSLSHSRSSSSRSRSVAHRGPRSPPEEEAAAAAPDDSAVHSANGSIEPRLRPRSPPSPPLISPPPPPRPLTPSSPPPPVRQDNDEGASAESSDGILRLVRAKKAELERAYRRDCDTFAVVAKVLVSKNSSLEEPVREALREALRDIGQHCVEELREFARSLASTQHRHAPSGTR